MVFAAVRTHFSRKTTACLVDGTAINKHPFKYNNEQGIIRSGRLVEWLERSPTVRVAGFGILKGAKFVVLSFLSFFYW